jgi:F-type H+-transporting ATPase subunit b
VTRLRLQAAILLVAVLFTGSALHAQQSPAESPQSSNSAQRDQSGAKQDQHHATPGGELARASNEAAGEEPEENAQLKHSPSVQLIAKYTGLSLHAAYWVSILFNFALLALLIVLISKSRLPAMFRTRTGEIQRGITEARKASDDANRRLADVETRLARLDAQVAEMRSIAEEEAVVEEHRILQALEDEKRKIVDSANAEIGNATKLAQRELKAFTAELAVSLAEKQIHVDSDTDRALVSNFVEQLNGSDSPGKGGR